MMKRIAAALLLAAPSLAYGHDVWVETNVNLVRAGDVVHTTRSWRTSRTAPPPARYGSPASSQSRRPTSAPAPNGAYVLCPENAT